jgi:hypothetical protein
MEWNRQLVNICYEYIVREGGVEEALFKLKEDGVLSPDTSENALRKAASRYGVLSPRQYLKVSKLSKDAVPNETEPQGAATGNPSLTELESVLLNSRDEAKRVSYWKKKAVEASTFVEQIFNMKTMIQDAALNVTPPTDSHDIQAKSGESVVVCIVSDIHAGKKFGSSNPRFQSFDKNKYDAHRMSLMGMMRDKLDKFDKPSKLVYAALGDNFESLFANMRDGQYLTMDATQQEQYEMVIGLHVSMLTHLCLLHPDMPIEAVFMPGNHDRLFESKGYDSEIFVNYLVCSAIASKLRVYKNLKIVCGKQVMSVQTGLGVELLLHHGHLSSNKTELDLINFAHVHGDGKPTRKVILQGHTHRFVSMQAGHGITGVWAPPFVTGDEYTHYNLNKMSNPGFLMMEITEDHDAVYGPFRFYK